MGNQRLASIALLLVAGCAPSIQETRINAPPASSSMTSRPAAAVEMFTSGPPERGHVDVALLEVKPSMGNDDSTGGLLGQLRTRAGQMGCDGLVIGGLQATKRDGELINGTCIVYTAPP
jgi:hypothetical protein